jgi:HK97 family phage prohead protease
MKIPALQVPFELKAADPTARTFRGLAAAFSKDLGNDVIHKGAFARTIAHWRAAKKARPIPLLDSHDRFRLGAVIGKMVDAEETDDGLEAEFEMVPDDGDAEKAMKRIAGGFVTGLSIGYEPVKFDYEQPAGSTSMWDRIRHLREVKLREVSVVVFPMNEDARVDPSTIKSLVDGLRAGRLTDEEKAELRALLDAPPAGSKADPAPAPTGLAPDDPRRIALEATLRDVTLRSLATRA